jgi:hypothetical protein
MATVAFTAFLPDVMPSVVGCADPVAVTAVRNACIEFCANTQYWQEVQDEVVLTATDFPYTVPAPTGAQTVQVLAVAVNGRPLGPTTQDELDSRIVDWRTKTGDPQVFFQYNPDELGVYLLPDANRTYSFQLRVAYAPNRTAAGVVSFVYEKHLEAIAAGALTRLLALPAQPWSNPQLAAYYRGFFNNAMTAATIEAQKSFNRVGMRVQIRRG